MKASLGEEEVLIVKESLRRELALSEAKVNLLREEIEGFEKKYELSSEDFVDKFERGELGDAQDYFEWWGLVRGLKKIEEQIGKIKAVLAH
ncbi:MAG: hypothetical protein QMD80_06160 [archaeon]|nr:hypothetical protein [archaeon]